MKQLSFIFLIFFLCSSKGFSQFSFGLEGGLTYTDIIMLSHPDNVVDEIDGKFAYQLGAYTILPINSFGLKTGIYYSNRGGKDDTGLSDNSILNLHYLGVPIMFRAQVVNKIHIEIGPEFNYLLSAKVSGETVQSPEYKDFDFGANIGLFYSILKNSTIGLKFYRGFTDVIKIKDDPFPNIRYVNQGLGLSITHLIL